MEKKLISFIPNEDRVLVFPFDTPDVTKTGLWIPGEAKAKPFTGRVVAAGPGKMIACGNCGKDMYSPMPRVGDFFLFPENAGTPLHIDGIEFRIMRATDLHANDPDKFDADCKELVAKKKDKVAQPVPQTMIE